MTDTIYPVVTRVVWFTSADTKTVEMIVKKNLELVKDGKTDDQGIFQFENGQIVVTKNWIDIESAEIWINFLKSLDSPLLVEASIIKN